MYMCDAAHTRGRWPSPVRHHVSCDTDIIRTLCTDIRGESEYREDDHNTFTVQARAPLKRGDIGSKHPTTLFKTNGRKFLSWPLRPQRIARFSLISSLSEAILSKVPIAPH